MTTMADLIADTKRMAFGSLPEQLNLIELDAAAGATSLKLEMSVEGISPGTLVSSGLNVWWVRGVNAATNTLTVIPGYEGSPQAAVSAGDFLYVRPRVTDWYVFSTLIDVLRQMSSPQNGLYKIGTFELDPETVYQTYDIPLAAQGMIGISSIRVLLPSSEDEWFSVPDRYWRWQADQNLIRMLYAVPASSQVQVVYKAPFTLPTALTDDVVATVGLSETMLDIPPLGATVSLLRTQEARRGQIQVQGDPRRAGETTAGQNSSVALQFERDFTSRMGDEYLRLVKRTGIYRGI